MYIYVCVYTHVQTSLFSLSLSLEILEQQSSFVRTIWNSLVRGWIGIAKNPDIEISGMEKWGWMRAVFPRIGKCGGNSFDPFEGSERGGDPVVRDTRRDEEFSFRPVCRTLQSARRGWWRLKHREVKRKDSKLEETWRGKRRGSEKRRGRGKRFARKRRVVVTSERGLVSL